MDRGWPLKRLRRPFKQPTICHPELKYFHLTTHFASWWTVLHFTGWTSSIFVDFFQHQSLPTGISFKFSTGRHTSLVQRLQRASSSSSCSSCWAAIGFPSSWGPPLSYKSGRENPTKTLFQTTVATRSPPKLKWEMAQHVAQHVVGLVLSIALFDRIGDQLSIFPGTTSYHHVSSIFRWLIYPSLSNITKYHHPILMKEDQPNVFSQKYCHPMFLQQSCKMCFSKKLNWFVSKLQMNQFWEVAHTFWKGRHGFALRRLDFEKMTRRTELRPFFGAKWCAGVSEQ